MRVFISSTYEDLKTYRQAAIEVVNRYEGIPRAMELFMASPGEPVEVCKEELLKCDVFVGIYAHWYGFIPEGETSSITRLEYELARDVGKPCLCFIVKKDFPWNPQFFEHTKYEELEAFLALIKAKNVVSFFESPKDFESKFASSLARLKEEYLAKIKPSSGSIAEHSFFPMATDRVFISYSNENETDRQVADMICTKLKSRGIPCWVAHRDIAAGQNWPDEISKAITNSRIMILVISIYAQKSRWVSREVTQAANENKIIIPFFIENVSLQKGFKLQLGDCQVINAYPSPMKHHFDLLLKFVWQHLGIEPLKPLEPKPQASGKKPKPECAKEYGKVGRNGPKDLPEDVKDTISMAYKVEKNKNLIFICYNHKDKDFLERLKTHLEGVPQKYDILPWSDKDIEVGDQWEEKIEEKLNEAKIFIMIISAYFLASNFIKKVELPCILERLEKERIKIFPIHWSDCAFEEHEWLKSIQGWQSDGKSLKSLDENKDEIQNELKKITLKICSFIETKEMPPEEGQPKVNPEPNWALPVQKRIFPGPAPAYFVNDREGLPVDIGTIWGLNRDSYIGVYQGIDDDNILEILVNKEQEFFNALKDIENSEFPIRWWFTIKSNDLPGILNSPNEIWSIVEESELVRLAQGGLPGIVIPGIYFGITQSAVDEKFLKVLMVFCKCLFEKIFPGKQLAIIINLCSNEVDLDQGLIKKILSRLFATFSGDIEISALTPPVKPFLENKKKVKNNVFELFFNEKEQEQHFTEKSGYFYYWIIKAFENQGKESKTQLKEKFPNIFKFLEGNPQFKRFNEELSQKPDIDIGTAEEVVNHIFELTKANKDSFNSGVFYKEFLDIANTYMSNRIESLVSSCAASLLCEAARIESLVFAAHQSQSCFSDRLLDAWVSGSNLNVVHYPKNKAVKRNIRFIDKLALALLRYMNRLPNIYDDAAKAEISKSSIKQLIRDMYERLRKEYQEICDLNFFENKESPDYHYRLCEFLSKKSQINYNNLLRSGLKFSPSILIDRLKGRVLDNIDIWRVFLGMPVGEKEIAGYLKIKNPEYRFVLGLCTQGELDMLKKDQSLVKYIRECRRLNFIYDTGGEDGKI
jgi:hypothetical protein